MHTIYYSTYSENTPGIVWNVSDIPLTESAGPANLYWFQLTADPATSYPIPGPKVVSL